MALDIADAAFTGAPAMKIVHVIPALTKGGAERVAIDLANWQVSNGDTVAVVLGLGIGDEAARALLDKRVEIRELVRPDTGSILRAYLLLPFWRLRNRDWLTQFDVMHCHLTFASVFGTMAKSMFARPGAGPAIVETNHAVGMAISRLKRTLLASMLELRDGIALMALDPFWQSFAARQRQAVVRLIPNGVAAPLGKWGSAKQRAVLRQQYGIPDSAELIVGTVSQLRDDRMPWRWIAIFAEIAAKLGPRVHFLIAGEGMARAKVEAEIARHDLGQLVHLCGTVESSAPPIALMDLYVTLAVGEIVGLAGLEASFAGVPMIAIQLRERFSNGPDHWFWSSGNDRQFACHAAELLAAPTELKALAATQHDAVVSSFTVNAMGTAYRRLYGDVLAARRNRFAGADACH